MKAQALMAALGKSIWNNSFHWSLQWGLGRSIISPLTKMARKVQPFVEVCESRAFIFIAFLCCERIDRQVPVSGCS